MLLLQCSFYHKESDIYVKQQVDTTHALKVYGFFAGLAMGQLYNPEFLSTINK